MGLFFPCLKFEREHSKGVFQLDDNRETGRTEASGVWGQEGKGLSVLIIVLVFWLQEILHGFLQALIRHPVIPDSLLLLEGSKDFPRFSSRSYG